MIVVVVIRTKESIRTLKGGEKKVVVAIPQRISKGSMS